MTSVHLYHEYIGKPCRQRLKELIAGVKEHDLLAPVTVIVPTPYAAVSLRRSLSGNVGLANVRFMVIPRLAEYLGAPVLAAQGKSPLTPLVEAATIRTTSVEMSTQQPLGRLALNPSLHSSLRRTFSELAVLSEQGLSAVSASDPLRAQIVQWYSLFRGKLDKYYSREDLYRAAVQALKTGKARGALKDLGFIIFYLITDLSSGETALIKSLGASNLCSIIMGMTGEEEPDKATGAISAGLRPEFAISAAASECHPPTFKANHLLVASTAREEVRWIIRRILQQAEAGLPFHKIAVLYRQQDPYAHLLPVQLHFSGIPVAGPDPSRLKDTPAGRFVLHLLEAIKDDLSRSSIMRWIAESPLKSGEGSDTGTPDLVRWETISRQAGITGGKEQWLERLEHYRNSLHDRIRAAEADDEISPSRIKGLYNQSDAALRLSTFITGLIDNLPPCDGTSWNEYVKWMKGMLSRYLSSPARWPQNQQESHEKIIRYLDELATLDDLMPGGTDLAAFHTMLDDLLDAPSGKTGTTGSGVFVAPVSAAQGMEFEHVFIAGAAESVFPPALPQDPLLPDRVRQSLSGGDSLPLQQTRRAGERRLYISALAAGSTCTLSYPRVNPTVQRPQFPSPWFLDELNRLAGRRVASAEIDALPSCQWLSFVYSTHHALTSSTTDIPADSHEYDFSGIARFHKLHRSIAGHYLARQNSGIRRFLQMERARQSSAFTPWDGNVSSLCGISRRLGLPQDRRFSPTRLERWATCPFRSFIADILGIAVLEQPEETLTISPVDRGSLLHRIMERFISEVQADGLMPDYGHPWGKKHRDMLLNVARAQFGEAEMQGITGRHLLWEIVKESILNDLVSLLQNDSRWRQQHNTRPYWVEKSFGIEGNSGLPPVELHLAGGEVIRLRGMIDRIDTNPDNSRIMVIDYKFGSTSPFKDMSKDPLGGGRHLQLPVYGLAAYDALDQPKEVTALYWFATTRGKFERKAVNLQECQAAFIKSVELIASGIASGLFPANPGNDSERNENCTYCDFDRICPASREILWERKSAAPELKPYLDLRSAAGKEERRE